MNTFTLSFLHQSLVERNAFLYHGAGIAKGIGTAATNAIPYLQRLKKVIAEDLEVCCSTVRPGDSEANFNFWGRIGLILSPKSPDSITLVSPKDAGTTPDQSNNGRRKFQRVAITSRALVESIDLRPSQSCNEWCVLDYRVIGVFIEPPIQYCENDELRDLNVSDVFAHFPGLPVYAFHNDSTLREVLPPNNWGAIAKIEQLYPFGNVA